jgi:archaellum biogenesis ATPase FlaH
MAKTEKITVDYDQLLNLRHYKHGYTPPQEQVFLKISNHTIGTAGNFIVFSGLPKAGKSTFIHAALASREMHYKNIFNISLDTDPLRPFIGYFDTESAEYDFYRNLERIKQFTNKEKFSEYFSAFNTRQDGAEMNRMLIETYIKNYPVSVVVVDGLLDLIKNYNDEIESRQLIDWLKAITAQYKVLIIGVIHTGKKDNHTLGHFGSMADRYAQSVLEVIKDRETDTYQLHPKYLRSSADFDPIAIKWSGGSYVETTIINNAPLLPKKAARR